MRRVALTQRSLLVKEVKAQTGDGHRCHRHVRDAVPVAFDTGVVRPVDAVDIAVVFRDMGALNERIQPLQKESASRAAEQRNRSPFTRTMVTALAQIALVTAT
jgi:hypothetical protein